MPDCYRCYKHNEVLTLRRRIVVLESGEEILALKERIAELEKQKNVTNPESADQPKSVTDLLLRIDKLQGTIAAQERKIEELETRGKQAEKQFQKERQAAKKQIDSLERDLSTEKWRHEKDLHDQKTAHEKEMKSLASDHEKELAASQAKFEAAIQDKDKTIADLRRLLDKSRKVIPPSPGAAEGSNNSKQVKANSQNSSVPPSQDPNHPIIRTNHRKKSEKHVGGQEGHPHHPRKKLPADDVIPIKPPQEVLDHPDEWYKTGEVITKQRICMGIVITVTEFQADVYRNRITKAVKNGDFPADLGHLEVNYDPSFEATIAWLHSAGNMPYNKISELLKEQTDGLICPSEGTMVNLEKRFAAATPEKREEIAKQMLSDHVMNIDGTFLRVNGKLEAVMVLKTPSGVFYTATGCKGKKALEQTFADQFHGVAVCDGEKTFQGVGDDYQRCLIHVSRYLKGAEQNEPLLAFPKKMSAFLWNTIETREIQKAEGLTRMDEKELEEVRKKYKELIEFGSKEYPVHPPKGTYVDGYNIYQDMAHNMDHMLLFLTDYDIPWHNNDAEKCARTIKVHSRINGGMRSFEAFDNHAKTMTVLETEHMNGQSRMEVLHDAFKDAKANDGSTAPRAETKGDCA